MKSAIRFALLLSVAVIIAIAAMWWRTGRIRAQQSSGVQGSSQQIEGTPGSPGATTTINGEQLPPPPQPFRGKIERNAAQSTPYWPMRVVPPKDAPNVLLIMTDDTGFGVTSTFGGVIPTPTLDHIAANGLRYRGHGQAR